ncbi:GntR family transcriptional regulator [Gordonia sp. CPCC 205333]|uniref:GntR family transcriptional regulator n=1 Tax=Gordonia sp. CPCC 205333 TaxID=3140790 RepID=UPI003AF3FA28
MGNEPSAATKVYEVVKELILTSEIPGGDLISEGDVARRCEVSRTPVREAFLRLETEGWMRLYPKRGALVLPVTEREAGDVLRARLLLEGHAVAQIVDRPAVRAVLLDDLRVNLAEHRSVDASDMAAFARIDAQFHQLIVTAGDNQLIAGFFGSLGERHRRMTTASVHRDPAVMARIFDDHAALIDAIDSGDPTAFDAALAAHLTSVHQGPSVYGQAIR